MKLAAPAVQHFCSPYFTVHYQCKSVFDTMYLKQRVNVSSE